MQQCMLSCNSNKSKHSNNFKSAWNCLCTRCITFCTIECKHLNKKTKEYHPCRLCLRWCLPVWVSDQPVPVWEVSCRPKVMSLTAIKGVYCYCAVAKLKQEASHRWAKLNRLRGKTWSLCSRWLWRLCIFWDDTQVTCLGSMHQVIPIFREQGIVLFFIAIKVLPQNRQLTNEVQHLLILYWA